MLLHIIRHGDPDYEHNTITDFGHKEAKALAKWFDDKNIRFDNIYTSPLGRAIDTASYTCNNQQITPEILPWTEESMDYMQPFVQHSCVGYSYSSNGIENYIDFAKIDRSATLQRLENSSDEFLASLGYCREGSHYRIDNHNNKRIAVFCHGGFGTAWTAYLLGMPPTLGFPSMFMTTTGVTTFEFRPIGDSCYTRPRMLRFSDISHLHAASLADKRI